MGSLPSIKKKLFFQYVSSKFKSKDQISNLVMSDGKLTETDAEKADVLKSFFHSVFKDSTNDVLPDFKLRTNATLSKIQVSEAQMLEALKSLRWTSPLDRMAFIPEF